ncbi:hypothetical protein GCM10022384_69330 [Streptomyces marokkonensis]|uniref:Uncharacterized protein n=1 Tax=Streptomyces marokkonensis TaxID=324855 RepID=A0ABP7SU01_9ACTN
MRDDATVSTLASPASASHVKRTGATWGAPADRIVVNVATNRASFKNASTDSDTVTAAGCREGSVISCAS